MEQKILTGPLDVLFVILVAYSSDELGETTKTALEKGSDMRGDSYDGLLTIESPSLGRDYLPSSNSDESCMESASFERDGSAAVYSSSQRSVCDEQQKSRNHPVICVSQVEDVVSRLPAKFPEYKH